MGALERDGQSERLVWSVEETAAVLGISRAHAYELVARGELIHVRLGRRIVIHKRALDDLLAPADPDMNRPPASRLPHATPPTTPRFSAPRHLSPPR